MVPFKKFGSLSYYGTYYVGYPKRDPNFDIYPYWGPAFDYPKLPFQIFCRQIQDTQTGDFEMLVGILITIHAGASTRYTLRPAISSKHRRTVAYTALREKTPLTVLG